jgi:hypothetical protein
LPLPEDSQQLRKELVILSGVDASTEFAKRLSDGTAMWPPDQLLSLLALAQHHGLPTRLMDWSVNAYIAAYFAASKAATWKRFFNLRKQSFAGGCITVRAPPVALWRSNVRRQTLLRGRSRMKIRKSQAYGHCSMHWKV